MTRTEADRIAGNLFIVLVLAGVACLIWYAFAAGTADRECTERGGVFIYSGHQCVQGVPA